MTDAIAPALTPEEWDKAAIEGSISLFLDQRFVPLEIMTEPDCVSLRREGMGDEMEVFAAEAPPVIALLNAMLPDTDPRRITWAMLDQLRKAVRGTDWTGASVPPLEERFIDALASYLPPR